MSTYRATNKTTGEVVEYIADAPDFTAYPESEWRQAVVQTAYVAPGTPQPTPTVYGGRQALTKLEFIALLGDAAYKATLSMAKTSVDIEAWVKKVELTTPDVDGYSIHLDNPELQAGVQDLEAALIAQGVVTTGWAQEVLNG